MTGPVTGKNIFRLQVLTRKYFPRATRRFTSILNIMKRANKTWVEISKSALTNNVRAFRRHVGEETSVMAVVKSNAYGHGLVEVAQIADKEDAG